MSGKKTKTISGPYQSYQIRVSVANLTELVSVQGAVDGAPTFVKDHNEPWYWFATLPSGITASVDGSSGAIAGTHGGFYVSLAALLALIFVIGGVAPFTGVNNGSARLLKAISAFELGSLDTGDLVYVESVIDFWKWLPLSTEADNTATECTVCAPTIVGVGPGRFVRMCIASPEVMLQTEWHFASTGSNEATGLPGSPLLTTSERRRRMGPYAIWRANTAYHIRYLSEGYADVIDGYRSSNAVVYCHASVNDFEGISPPLYSGVVDARDLLNTATGQPYTITSNGLPTSWTASGLIDARIRLTSGASVKALSSAFFQDAVTPKKAWCDEFLTGAASLSVAPFVAPGATQAAPAVNDTFVVESLRTVARLEIRLINPPDAQITATGCVLDSLLVTTLIASEESGVYAYGCRINGTPIGWNPAFESFRSTIFGTFALSDLGLKSIVGGHIASGSLVLVNNTPSNSNTITNFTLNGTTTLFLGGSGNGTSPDTWRPGQIGCHNRPAANSPFLFCGNGCRLAAVWVPYGLNNAAPLIKVEQNCVGIAQAGSWTPGCDGYQTTSPNVWQPVLDYPTARTSIPAFDLATSLYTAPRLLSKANMQASVAAGGFDYVAVDPFTGAGFVRY